MSEIKDEDILSILHEVSKSIILPKFRNLKKDDIKLKNNTDLVTSVDMDVEVKLKDVLLNLLPKSLFVGEESFFKNPNIIDSYKESKFCWTVDPIDGTKNFVNGGEKFAVMIGLTFKEKIIQSWIYNPLTNDFCSAKLDQGCLINGNKLKIIKKIDIFNSIGSISSKYWDIKNNINIVNIKDKFKEVSSYGCIGLEYVDIAKSKRDYVILSKLHPWDHIPGILIVKESGGSIIHFDESNYNHIIQKNNLIVSNSDILKNQIIKLIKVE